MWMTKGTYWIGFHDRLGSLTMAVCVLGTVRAW